MLKFGLPERIASSPEAQSVFMVYSSRTTIMGVMLYTFWLKRMYSAMDIILICLGWAGVADGYVCWKEGVPGTGVFRLVSGLVLAGLGAAGITEGR